LAYDPNDKGKVEKRSRREKLKAKQAIDDLQALMKDERFRRFVHGRLVACHIWTPSFSPDPYTTAFNEGERNMGLTLFAAVEDAAPLETAMMIAEASGAKAQEKAVQAAEDMDPSTEG
jgi:hypothetical protein